MKRSDRRRVHHGNTGPTYGNLRNAFERPSLAVPFRGNGSFGSEYQGGEEKLERQKLGTLILLHALVFAR